MALPPPLTKDRLSYWKERLGKIQPDTPRRFGKLEPAEMLRHLRRTLEPVLGEYTPEDCSNMLTRNSLFHSLFIHMPWPKGKVKAPDWLTPAAEGDLQAERAALFEAMEKFCTLVEKDPSEKISNPLLGMVALDYTAKLQGKHLDHHCQQFGV